MILIIAVAVVGVIVVTAAIAVLVSRRASRSGAQPAPDTPHEASARFVESSPMTGLESALSQVTDRSGRPIREAIDAEAGHVDDFRVPDDTGPLLRRALDHVAPPSAGDASDAPDDSTGQATDGDSTAS